MRLLSVLGLMLVLAGIYAQQTIQRYELKGVTVARPEQVGVALESLLGQPADDTTIQSALQNLIAWYQERGYVLARVLDYEVTDEGVLVVEVAEGVIESVEVQGNRRTRSEFLRQLVGARPGEVYNEARFQRVRQRIGRFPFLSDAKLGPEPGETVGSARLILQVQEERSTDLAIAAGYTTDEGLVGYVDAQETNLFGLGHRVRFQWQREQVRDPLTSEYRALEPSYALSYEAPRVLPGAFNFGVEVYDRAPFYPVFYSDLNSLRRYERRRGFATYIGLDWRELFELRLRFRSDRVDYNRAPFELISPTEQINNRGDFSALGLQVIYDSREGRFANKGLYGNLLAERTLSGGDFEFTRVIGELQYLIPLASDRTLALRGVAGFGSDTMPLSELFWIGGYDLLRGYGQDEFRGNRAVVVSAEYRFPVLEATQAVVFLDAGSAWQSGQSTERITVRLGAGAGLRFASPIGLIRLDVAYGRRGFVYLSLAGAY